jgi:hypothetical protein
MDGKACNFLKEIIEQKLGCSIIDYEPLVVKALEEFRVLRGQFDHSNNVIHHIVSREFKTAAELGKQSQGWI